MLHAPTSRMALMVRENPNIAITRLRLHRGAATLCSLRGRLQKLPRARCNRRQQLDKTKSTQAAKCRARAF